MLRPLFALNELRGLSAHAAGRRQQQKLKKAIEVFGIEHSRMASGWGQAVDALYDTLTRALAEATRVIRLAT